MTGYGIHIALAINNFEVAEAISERIDTNGRFTRVLDIIASDVPPIALGLLYLNSPSFFNPSDDDFELYICIIRKGQRVATGQVRIQVSDFVQLDGITTQEIIDKLPKRLQFRAKSAFDSDIKKLPTKTAEYVLDAVLELCPQHEESINKLSSLLSKPKIFSRSPRNQDAAVEKDAVSLALDIFGVDRKNILKNWNYDAVNMGASFLNGIDEYVAYEDDIISNDLHTLPGWDVAKKSITGFVEFTNKDGGKLTVINANRKPIEKATGVDLIYFHRNFEAFTFVQYKMMDKHGKNSNDYYFNPNQKSHTDELARMQRLQKLIDSHPEGKRLIDYRLVKTPIYFKVCRKLQLKTNDTSIATGAYIPLDYWEKLLKDPSTQGERGGRKISYSTLNKRYIGTGEFVYLVQKGFLGTHSNASKKIALFVEDAIKNGHSVMYAIEKWSKKE